ncbi:MAG: cytochrome P450 [Alphaproteobacteria bacterium]
MPNETSLANGRSDDRSDAWAADPHTFDIFKLDQRFLASPYATYARLRQDDPVHRNADGSYLVTRYDDVARVLRDPDMSSDNTRTLTPVYGQTPLLEHYLHLMVFVDPPRHTHIRRRLAHAFTPRALKTWEVYVEHAVRELLDEALAKGRMDLITEFAYLLPISVIAKMLGVPREDQALFRRWSAGVTKPMVPSPAAAVIEEGSGVVEEFKAYFRTLAERRRREPRDDLMSLLVQDDGSEPLDELDLIHNAAFLLNAGHETTMNLLGNALAVLFRFPDQLARLRRNPDLFETAVEEFLRFDSPNQLGGRRTTKAIDFHGVTIPADTFIWISNGAANRDTDQFAGAENLDVGRQPNRHLAFGYGIHACLGANLARVEAKIALRTLICDHPNLRADGTPVPRMHPRYRGFTSFPVAA